MTLGRKEVANGLKPAITDPTIRIEEKNCSLYSIPNCLNFISFTNHEDALPIEHGDRRWLVVFSPARPRDNAYYQGLFEFLDGDGAAYVKHWLLKRKVALNPHGVAPFTAGKEAMRRLSIGDAEAYLLELFEERQPPFDFDLTRLLRDLMAAEDLIARLDATCNRHGGAQAMLAGFGGAITCIGYWRLEFGTAPEGIALWEKMAAEHQAVHRGNAGKNS